ncbi:MAG: DUF2723 domain-containing protein [Myxococcales bacterium]|nr:DUF2723 domain-containing protein [Myxococcales bacterium]
MNREGGWQPELVAFLVGSAVYSWLLAAGVLWMDVGELAAAAATLGGAHPPGHPGHSLLGKLACFLPIGEVATRLSFLSALASATMLAGLVRLVRVFFPEQRVMALLVVVPVAFAPGILLNATRPEVYTPTFALLVWAQVFALQFLRAKAPSPRHALLSVFLLALSASFHPAIALAASLPTAMSLCFVSKKRILRLAPPALLLVLLAGALYLSLPSRALATTTPALVWGDPSSAEGFWRLITADVYQGNFAHWSLGERVASCLALLAEGPGLILLLIGTAGLGFGALTQLRGAGTLLATSLTTLLAGALQSHFNPDMRAYLALMLLASTVGAAIFAMALFRALPLPEKRDWHSAVFVMPIVAMALCFSPKGAPARDRSDDAMQFWDETVGVMPAGPGLFFASGDHSLFVAQYERLVAGARPDIAIANQELVRDAWFLRHLRGLLPELYLPFIDDGQKGNIAERLYWENARRGVPVWSDSLAPKPVAASPIGRGFAFHTSSPLEEVSGVLTEVPPPLQFRGLVGSKVAKLTALRRAQYEAARGNISGAAKALGVQERIGPALLANAPQRPSLYPHLPSVGHHFLVADFATALFAEDLVWQLGGEQLAPVGTGQEERIHLAWRLLLAGDANSAQILLDALDPAGLAATTPMLIAIGEAELAETRLRTRIAAHSKDADSLSALGSVIGNKGDPASLAEAREFFHAALALDDQNSETWTRTGLVLIKEGKPDLAREAWTTALKLDPKRRDAAEYLRRLDAER